MTNFYERQLKRMFGDSEVLSADTRFAGKAMISKISDELRAKIEFVTARVSGQYEGLKLSIINKNEGLIDTYGEGNPVKYYANVAEARSIAFVAEKAVADCKDASEAGYTLKVGDKYYADDSNMTTAGLTYLNGIVDAAKKVEA